MPEAPPAPAVAGAANPRADFVGPIEAITRYPWLLVGPLLGFMVVAAFIGALRQPTYVAQVRLDLTNVALPADTLESVTTGNEVLAANYALSVSAPGVYVPAGRSAGVSSAVARSELSASAIPGTTLILLEAKTHDNGEAIRLANSGAQSLISYVKTLSQQGGRASILRQFKSAAANAARLQALVQSLRQRGASQAALSTATLDLQAAQLQASNLSDAYRAAPVQQAGTDSVQLLVPATTASSDRVSKFELVVFVGALAGAVFGALLAVAVANRPRVPRRTA